MKLLISVIIAVLIVNCSPKGEFKTQTWSINQEKTVSQHSLRRGALSITPSNHLAPLHLLKEIEKGKSKSIQLKQERLQAWQQQIYEVPVRNSYFRYISSGAQPKFLDVKYLKTDHKAIKVEIEKQRQKQTNVTNKINSYFSKFYPKSEVLKPKLEIILNDKNPQLVWSAVALNTSGVAIQYDFNLKLKLIQQKKVSSHLVPNEALVYTENPMISTINSVSLQTLKGTGKLESNKFTIRRAPSHQVFDANHIFKYSPKATEFDEVQTYYYTEKALLWLKEKANLELPFHLDIIIHYGAPQWTNASFYYQGNIRIGRGDNKKFSDMSKDPTIITHEIGHAVVETIARLQNVEQTQSINEAYADFIAALINKSPEIGSYSYMRGSYRRTLANQNIAFRDFNGGTYNDSLAVSGMLWDLKKSYGEEASLMLALQTLARLKPMAKFNDFTFALKDAAASNLQEKDYKNVLKMMEARGWYSAQL